MHVSLHSPSLLATKLCWEIQRSFQTLFFEQKSPQKRTEMTKTLGLLALKWNWETEHWSGVRCYCPHAFLAFTSYQISFPSNAGHFAWLKTQVNVSIYLQMGVIQVTRLHGLIVRSQKWQKLPPRKITSSWTATKHCLTSSQPQKLFILYEHHFCSPDSYGAMSLLYKVTHTESVKPWITQWEGISARPGKQGATESYSHPFHAWSEPVPMGCCKHQPGWLPFCKGPYASSATKSHPKWQQRPKETQYQSPAISKNAAVSRLHPDPSLLSRLKPRQAWASAVPLSSAAIADVQSDSPLQT